jgi:hypothetical protein
MVALALFLAGITLCITGHWGWGVLCFVALLCVGVASI